MFYSTEGTPLQILCSLHKEYKGLAGETGSKSSALWVTGTKSSALFPMGTKSSALLVLCTLAAELRNGGRHPFGDCTLRIDLSDSHKSHLFSSIHYVYR